MLGRGGSWSGNTVAGLSLGRFWLYQDFAAGSGPNLTITGNDNGSGGSFSFDSSNIVNSSAVVSKQNGDPIYTNAASEIPANLVKVSTHTAAAVALNGTPAVGEGIIRVWYLYAMSTEDCPSAMEVAPRFVKESRTEYLDAQYLNAALNLSDIANAATGRTNLGFTSQTAGRVLLGVGDSTFTSDSALFFDTSNDRLGIGTASPSQHLHVFHATVQPIALIEAQFTANPPILRLQAARDSNANLANADVAGQIDFYGRFNSSTGALGYIQTVYTGNGTTQTADMVFFLGSAGAPAEKFRIKADGTIDTVLGAGVVQSDANGVLSSGTLSIANGGTGATSIAAGVVTSNGSALSSEAQLAVTRGGTGLSAVGTANYLFGTNAAGNAFEHKAVEVTAAGVITIAAGAVGAPTIGFSGSTTTGIYSSGAGTFDIAAGGVQAFSSTSTATTLPLATTFKTSIALEDPDGGTNKVTIQASTSLAVDFTLTLPTAQGASGDTLLNDGSGNLSWGRQVKHKAGTSALTENTTTKAISFATAWGDTNYVISAVMRNTTDVGPFYQPVLVIAKSSTGFTVEWNEPLTTGNYVLEWSAIATYDP